MLAPASPTTVHPLPRRLAVAFGLLVVLACVAAEPTNSPEPPVAPAVNRFAFDKDRAFLSRVTDFSPLSVGGADLSERREQEPFEDLVLHAHQFATQELSDAARRDVGMGDLMAKDELKREDLRFELVRFDGRLKRLKRMGTFPNLRAAGIDGLYEAWVFPTNGPALTPVCFIVSEPPAGVQPAEDFTPGVPVSGSGYFFKIVEYASYEPNPNDRTRTMYRRAPVVVGRAVLAADAAPTTVAGVDSLLTVSLAGGAALIAVLVACALWLRRSDGGSRRAAAHRLRNPYPAGGPQPPIWEQPPTPPDDPATDRPEPGTPTQTA